MLSEPTEEKWREILAKPIARERKTKTQMNPDTRALLRKFYAPFTKDLAKQLNDPKFEWAEEQAQAQPQEGRRRGAARRSLAAAAGGEAAEEEGVAGASGAGSALGGGEGFLSP